MAGFSSGGPTVPITNINVTPLVDITLVLLIIFMVTAKLVVSQALPMNLPRAATGTTTQQLLSVELQADGRVSFNGQSVRDDGVIIEHAYQPGFPPQVADVSYGVFGPDLQAGYFAVPTPNAPNAASFLQIWKRCWRTSRLSRSSRDCEHD